MAPENVKEISSRLNVKEVEVTNMEGRLFSGDQSLNITPGYETDKELQDLIEDDRDTQDIITENNNEFNYRKKLFLEALTILNPREKEIIRSRRLRDKPKKLEELSIQFKISRERVRQIEEKAMEKLQKEILNTNQ